MAKRMVLKGFPLLLSMIAAALFSSKAHKHPFPTMVNNANNIGVKRAVGALTRSERPMT